MPSVVRTLLSVSLLLLLLLLSAYAQPQPCVSCGKVMPICNCPPNTACSFVPQSCNACAKYNCVPVPAAAKPSIKTLPHKQPEECVICTLAMPSCEPCFAIRKVCAIREQTCHRCAYVDCI